MSGVTGYRNLLDLSFRNEIDSVIKMAKARASKNSATKLNEASSASRTVAKSPGASTPELAVASSASFSLVDFSPPSFDGLD